VWYMWLILWTSSKTNWPWRVALHFLHFWTYWSHIDHISMSCILTTKDGSESFIAHLVTSQGGALCAWSNFFSFRSFRRALSM
jgi:hypothetical protein